MDDPAYGQQEPMENDAMVRTLDTQARAIWPQERFLLKRFLPKPGLDILDVGCGTGEIASRIAKEFSPHSVTGIDLAEAHITRAKSFHKELPNISFEQGDATKLRFSDNSFDAALCRHMLQAVPDPSAVIREMIRVVKPGGTIYALAEDYGMLFFHPTKFDADDFFANYAGRAASKGGSDLRQGRKMSVTLMEMRCAEITVEYICIDTLRVDRNLLGDIFLHWRDGFAEWISRFSGHPLPDVRARFDDMIACTRNPSGYAAWLIPSISARVTPESKGAIAR